jgi:hypothetical protein
MSLSAGPNNPSAASGTGWSGSGAGIESNSLFTSQTITAGDSGTTNELVGTTFGFSIPTNATIVGIVFTLARKVTSISNFIVETTDVNLLKAGVAAGSTLGPGSSWVVATTDETWGTSTSLWGTTWTPAQVNAVGFGAEITVNYGNEGAVSRTLSVQNYRLTVYYTTPTSKAVCSQCIGW